MSERPLILISNDDGVQAQGIQELTAMMRRQGEVIVVAPDGPRSASSCCISPLNTITVRLLKQEDGLTIYQCSGTPTDCVKLAMDGLLTRRPDLVVSGINHGDNASVSLHYSGTVGAVLEACMKGVPAIAYSLKTKSQQCNFRPYEEVVIRTARYALENGLPQDVLLNVNFPEVEELKGTKVCRMGRGRWMKEMKEDTSMLLGAGERAFHLTGYFQNLEPDAEDTDYWALDHGFAAITPIGLDMTEYKWLEVSGEGLENTFGSEISTPNNPLTSNL